MAGPRVDDYPGDDATGRLRTAEIVSHRESLDWLSGLVTWMGRHEGLFSKVMFFPNGRVTA